MVFERGRGSYESEMLDDEGTGLAQVCPTTLSDPQDKLDTVDIDPLDDILADTPVSVHEEVPCWHCRFLQM